jgi:hypothetical protein
MSAHADNAVCKQTDANGVVVYGDCTGELEAAERVDVDVTNIASPPPAVAIMNNAQTSPDEDDGDNDDSDDSNNDNDDGCDDCGDYVDDAYVNPRAVDRALDRADDEHPEADRVRDEEAVRGGGIRGGGGLRR